jgi:hypothetical protein
MSRIVGPAIAGLVIGYYGVGMCFLVNSISFAAVIISLFFIHPLTIQATVTSSKRILADIKDGRTYIYRRRILFDAVLLLTIIGTFAMNNNVLSVVKITKPLHKPNMSDTRNNSRLTYNVGWNKRDQSGGERYEKATVHTS